MNRRGFLSAILATGCAPAIVRAESLMKIWVPKPVEDSIIIIQQYSNDISLEAGYVLKQLDQFYELGYSVTGKYLSLTFPYER